MQIGLAFLGSVEYQVELPSPADFVVPGLQWGAIEDFPTPAYWAFQAFARRASGIAINNRMGETLKEEVSACLLGSHGVPANVAFAAFKKLKEQGLLSATPTEKELFEELSKPLNVSGRETRYRFASQKSRYISFALERLTKDNPPQTNGPRMRNWLVSLPGIGLKIGSWIARNWLDSNDVAVVDVHLFRAGVLSGFFQGNLSISQDYLELEERFLSFSQALGVKPTELDAVIWDDMRSSPLTVHRLIKQRQPPGSIQTPSKGDGHQKMGQPRPGILGPTNAAPTPARPGSSNNLPHQGSPVTPRGLKASPIASAESAK